MNDVRQGGGTSPLRRAARALAFGLTAALISAGCSSSKNTEVRVAAERGTNERVDPVGFDSYEISSALGDSIIPTEAPHDDRRTGPSARSTATVGSGRPATVDCCA